MDITTTPIDTNNIRTLNNAQLEHQLVCSMLRQIPVPGFFYRGGHEPRHRAAHDGGCEAGFAGSARNRGGRAVISRLDAFTTLVIFALEHGGEEQVMVRRAIARLEPMIENLRRAAKFGWGPCPRCGGQSHAVICWQSKQDLPEWLRRLDTVSIEGADRRDVDEQILAWAITKRRAA